MPLCRLLLFGDLVTGFHIVYSLVLLETGVALQPTLHIAVHLDALAAASLARG